MQKPAADATLHQLIGYCIAANINIAGVNITTENVWRLIKNEEEAHATPFEVSPLSTAAMQFRTARRECCNILAEMQTKFESLRVTQALKEQLSEVPQLITELTGDECNILVFGDTSSGKSNLLNTILGQPLLPVKGIAATSALCVVRDGGGRRCANVYRKGVLTETLNFEGMQLADVHAKLDPILAVSRKRNLNQQSPDMVEVLWSGDILESGIRLIDSPGLSEQLSENIFSLMAGKFLPNAVGVIGVINCAQGCVTDNTGKMIDKAVLQCSFGCAAEDSPLFFVLTKLDLLPDGERDPVVALVRGCITKKIAIRDDRIARFNGQYAKKFQERGRLTPEARTMLMGIVDYMAATLRLKLQRSVSKAFTLLGNLRMQLVGVMETDEKARERVREAQTQLPLLHKNRDRVKAHLLQFADEHQKQLARAVMEALRQEKDKVVRAVDHVSLRDGKDERVAFDVMQDRVGDALREPLRSAVQTSFVSCHDLVSRSILQIVEQAKQAYGNVFFQLASVESLMLGQRWVTTFHAKPPITLKSVAAEVRRAVVGNVLASFKHIAERMQVVQDEAKWKQDYAAKLFDQAAGNEDAVRRLCEAELVSFAQVVEPLDRFVTQQIAHIHEVAQGADRVSKEEAAAHVQWVCAVEEKLAKIAVEHMIPRFRQTDIQDVGQLLASKDCLFTCRARLHEQNVLVQEHKVDTYRDLFQRDAEMSALPHHPNIALYHGMCLAPSGHAWHVFEYAEHTLEQLLERGIPEKRVHGLLTGIVNGLAALHDRRLVHGNLQPCNVWIRDAAVPLLAGIGAAGSSSSAYGAPEGGASREADVFSLGLLIWQVHHPAEKPGAGLPAVRTDLPPAIHAVLAMCLCVKPAERASCAEVLAALQ